MHRNPRDTHSRSIAKGATWRVIASLTTMVLVYVYTGNLLLTLELGIIEIVAKIFFYYLHKRGWEKIKWGKKT
jgi:adenylylsulfate kinase